MPRPGRNIEQALLASGRALYPSRGAAGLSVRALAEHAGAQAGMFHYHFASKDEFLRALLDGWYESMFGGLTGRAAQEGPALERLRQAIGYLARFARDERGTLGRVMLDAASGEEAALHFLRRNAPRHLKVLLALMQEAECEGALAPMPTFQRFMFVMGAVAMPVLVAPGVRALGVAPRLLGRTVEAQVTSDAAIEERIDMALRAIAAPEGKRKRG